ncbi:MAG: hypothetical protein GY795_09080 [Desulfobacterales bacterium]|nr:hypothetical protein [Desulfobacterales bacterium]
MSEDKRPATTYLDYRYAAEVHIAACKELRRRLKESHELHRNERDRKKVKQELYYLSVGFIKMLNTLNKIREIAFNFDKYHDDGNIIDYRIQLNGDLGISVYVLTEQKGLTDYSAHCSGELIKIREFTKQELEEDDFHKFVFENKHKIDLGYRERLRSLLEPDIENKFDSDENFPPIMTFYSYKGGLGALPRSQALLFIVHFTWE